MERTNTADAEKALSPPKKRAKRTPTRAVNSISARFTNEVLEQLAQGKRIRRTLPQEGRLNIDRQLPFLCVYRHSGQAGDQATARLVVGQAAYLVASAEKRHHNALSRLITGIATVLKDAFGSFLLVEVWAGENNGDGAETEGRKPTFRLVLPRKHSLGMTVSAFEQALQDVEIHQESADVEVQIAKKACPPGLPALLTPSRAAALGCHVMGIQVRPVYLDPATGQAFPMLQKALRERLGAAYRRGFFDFTRRHTTHLSPHYHALGPRAMVKAVWSCDEKLAQVSNGFDLLLAVTPTNGEEAWSEFRRWRFQVQPDFFYRPLPLDPSLLKRQLYNVPLEKIEDPTLANLFLEQQRDLDLKITLLADRGNRNFLYTGMQLYGDIPADLVDSANQILDHLPLGTRDESGSKVIDAQAFALRAREEIEYLKVTHPDINSGVRIRKDIIGLMVSRGNLLIGANLRMPATRVPAAIAHEVGTHIVTYINARAQPFRQLYVGLPGYDELQEGLAVLSEYLTGGLNRPRLRLLAARVIAARMLIDGADFIEVFRTLDRNHEFSQRTAFNITLRVFRGGGFPKDAVYLRGLLALCDYLKDGGALDPLYLGKFSLTHVPIIRELQLRRVLGPVPLRPSFLDDPRTQERLDRVRSGLTLPELISRRKQ